MAELVDVTQIEAIVGARREADRHLARAVSGTETVYVLHSRACCYQHADLRLCPFSIALDAGTDMKRWRRAEDRAVVVDVVAGRVVPRRRRVWVVRDNTTGRHVGRPYDAKREARHEWPGYYRYSISDAMHPIEPAELITDQAHQALAATGGAA